MSPGAAAHDKAPECGLSGAHALVALKPPPALVKVRKTIRAAAPQATETISYRMPTFKLDRRFLVSYAAFKNHCSLFPWTEAMVEEFGDELEPYLSGRGTLRFTAAEPIPAALVKKIVKERIREHEAQTDR
ncbi:MAG: DUF1801 domain-containing protein [Actinobacteria bacterium]|nr:DUF1801 domain-containing protein [Actinomycetota bacterium]